MVPLLVSNAKEFFEDPTFLIGVPLLALGALGVLVAFAPIDELTGRLLPAGAAGGAAAALPSPLWAALIGFGLILVGLGAAFHVALVIGGAFIAAVAAVRLAQETFDFLQRMQGR
jgi:hypothetical protein